MRNLGEFLFDGKKIAFTGDNLFGDPSDPSQNGHEAVVARNSAILEEGYILGSRYLRDLKPEQHFTEPPPRFTFKAPKEFLPPMDRPRREIVAAFRAYQVQYVDRLRQANGVDLARARESLRSAQWDLERVCRRIYGQDAPPNAAQAVQININLRAHAAAIRRRMGEQGRVLLRVLVTPDGQAHQVELKTSGTFVAGSNA